MGYSNNVSTGTATAVLFAHRSRRLTIRTVSQTQNAANARIRAVSTTVILESLSAVRRKLEHRAREPLAGVHPPTRRGYSDGMPTRPPERRVSSRLPRSLWIGLATVGLVVVAVGLWFRFPNLLHRDDTTDYQRFYS